MPVQGQTEVVVEDDIRPDEPVVIAPQVPEKLPSESAQLATKIREDFDKLYGGRLESVESRLRQALRQNDQLRADMGRLAPPSNGAPVTPPPTPEPVKQKDELDALVEQGRWKEAVSQLAAKEAQVLFNKQQEIAWQQAELTQRQARFETSKQAVIDRYPDLDPDTGDEESAVSLEFNKVLNEQSWLLREPLGPTEAMRVAEERLIAQGVDIASFRATSAPSMDNKEVIRRQRASLSGMPASRPAAAPGTMTMTRSEKEMVDYLGLTPEEYVKHKQVTDANGVVEA